MAKQRLTARVEQDVYDKIEVIIREEGMSINQFLIRAVNDYLNQYYTEEDRRNLFKVILTEIVEKQMKDLYPKEK